MGVDEMGSRRSGNNHTNLPLLTRSIYMYHPVIECSCGLHTWSTSLQSVCKCRTSTCLITAGHNSTQPAIQICFYDVMRLHQIRMSLNYVLLNIVIFYYTMLVTSPM